MSKLERYQKGGSRMTCPKGKGGRPKTTNNEKRILGVRNDRINDNEPALIAVSPSVPDWDCELDEIGNRIFQYYSKMLFANGTVGKSDETSLYQLAYTMQEWIKQKRICDKKGRNIPVFNKSGKVIGSVVPSWAKNERELHRDFVKQLREFGCTPLSRGAIVRISKGEEAMELPQIT
jgi:phage terminase small subunit